jgi:Flp pilus assembly pilin Flp
MIRLEKLRSCLKDERGVSAIEFAFLAPILATLILGIIDLSTGLSHRFTLQQALNRSLEMVQANRVQTGPQGGTLDYSFLRQEVATAADVPLADVTLTNWRECDGARQSTPEGICPDVPATATTPARPADTARYLELTVTKEFRGKVYLKPVVLRANAAVRVQ